MNKFFVVGSIIAIISACIGFVTSAWHFVFYISGISFIIPFAIDGM